jgi:hypothetical protein
VGLGLRAFLGVRGCCYGVVNCVLGCYLVLRDQRVSSRVPVVVQCLLSVRSLVVIG